MSATSKIEWTQRTWNPIAGCSIVSPGCHNCYAMRMAKRLAAMGQTKYAGTVDENGRWTGVINFDESALLEPLKRKKPTTWFVNSMSDLFHENVPFEFIDRVFAVMNATAFTLPIGPESIHWHTYQVLTKRADRMRAYMESRATDRYTLGEHPLFRVRLQWPPPNVMLGVSAEDQKRWNQRVPVLAATPAAVRFVSAEPLLGPIDPREPFEPDYEAFHDATIGMEGWEEPEEFIEECEEECDWVNYGRGLVHSSEHREWEQDRRRYAQLLAFRQAIDWLIVGGESGPGARPMHPEWVRRLRDDCQGIYATVAFFFKQWGEWFPIDRGGDLRPFSAAEIKAGFARWGKKAAGRVLDGREWDELPDYQPQPQSQETPS